MFTIRRSEWDDVPALLDVYQQGNASNFVADSRQTIGLLEVMDWQEASSDRHPLLVVEHQGELIAWCSLEPFYGLPAFDRALEVSLYVLPKWQGHGLGKQFLQHLDCHHADIGFTHLVAYLYATNHHSLALFTGQRFEQWGRLPSIASHNGVAEDVLLLGRIYSC
ncbi:N-acetyltransferase [Marinomonas sp. A79]|uniref:N-acetyltransferase n=1 Tax=Marinomonas vulgaris TaxID=2823372 RepID=A0ABS5HC79_9GAMM|nr:GNAT family N-acetyltransferase [Marinomonas vulgaris]MBR7888993.1 N-acetyltransferase [Marinomonas vulgaris]